MGPHPPGHQTWDPLIVTSGGDHWRSVQTCLFEDPQEQHLAVASETEAHTVSKRLVRIYWNAFLCHLLEPTWAIL